jgi:cellulose synthase/poly-beta-1,6-N-acetylglucosamine synthase-like glycosyltransferase
MNIVALVPAHQEEASIFSTVSALLCQERVPDRIVVVADNCTDATVARTREVVENHPGAPLVIVRTVDNAQRKSGALNWAWHTFCRHADLLITLDADTVLPPNAVADWEAEFLDDEHLAGSSSKFTMPSTGTGGGNLLVRLQRAEFARWTITGLRRGWTSVLAGTGCAIRNSVLREIAAREDRTGPWSHDSQVEDFELTYRIRQTGHTCHISPTVRAYTDAMPTLKSLWGQRMKWQVGTCQDLLTFGVNRFTRTDWCQQIAGLAAALVRVGWVSITLAALLLGVLQFHPIWLLPTILFIANDTRQALHVPHRDKWDVLMATLLLPQELFAWLRAGWFLASWWEVLRGERKDRWTLQYVAEGERG